MKCFILGAGKGTRMFPISFFIPKYLMPFKEGIFLEEVISSLKKSNLTPILVKKPSMPCPIEGLKCINISKPRDIIQTIYQCKNYIKEGETFCWIGGDILFHKANFIEIIKLHQIKKALSSCFFVENRTYLPRADIERNIIKKFSLNRMDNLKYTIPNFFVWEKKIFDYIKKGNMFNFMQRALDAGEVLIAVKFKNKIWELDYPKDYFNLHKNLVGKIFVDRKSKVNKTFIKDSYIYNGKLNECCIENSILLNVNLKNIHIKNKVFFGDKNVNILDIPNKL